MPLGAPGTSQPKHSHSLLAPPPGPSASAASSPVLEAAPQPCLTAHLQKQIFGPWGPRLAPPLLIGSFISRVCSPGPPHCPLMAPILETGKVTLLQRSPVGGPGQRCKTQGRGSWDPEPLVPEGLRVSRGVQSREGRAKVEPDTALTSEKREKALTSRMQTLPLQEGQDHGKCCWVQPQRASWRR